MAYINLKKLLDFNSPKSNFRYFLHQDKHIDENTFLISRTKPWLRKKSLTTIINGMGVKALESIVNLSDSNTASAYLKVLKNSYNIYTIITEITKFKLLNELQRDWLNEFAVYLKTGMNLRASLDEELIDKYDCDYKSYDLLNKYYSGAIIRFLISYIEELNKLNPNEVKKVIKQLKEPYASSEDQVLMRSRLNESLFKASYTGEEKEVRVALSKGADPDFQAGEGFTPLLMAILKRHDNIVKVLLRGGANPNLEAVCNRLPLNCVIQQGNHKVLELLLKHGADPNRFVADYSNTPLNTAISMRCVKSIKLLLTYGASLKCLGKGEKLEATKGSSLIYAVLLKEYEIVKAMLPVAEDINEKWGRNYLTPLIIASQLQDFKIAKLLIQNGADVNIQDRVGKTALSWAIQHNSFEIASLILKHGGDANIADETGFTPLMIASYSGFTKIAKLLLKNNAHVNHESKYFKSALIQAIFGSKDINILKLLIKAGANVNASFTDGYTPLIAAVRSGDITKVNKLLKYGADPNLQNRYGETALIILAGLTKYNKTIADSLVRNGANLEISNVKGTPLMHAAEDGNIDAIKDFIKLGAKIDYDHEGRTALLQAIYKRETEAVELLISLGAKFEEGKALYEAAESNCIEIINILLSKGADSKLISKPDFASLERSVKKKFICVKEVIEIIKEWRKLRGQLKSDETKLVISPATQDITTIDKIFEAVENNDYKAVKDALSSGLEPNTINKHGISLLSKAVTNGHYKMTELLLKNKADPNKHKGYYYAPLHAAITEYNLDIAKLLLKHKANPNIENWDGDNLLLKYGVRVDYNLIKLLLKHGLNPNIISKSYGTGFSAIVKWEALDSIKLCLKYGADPNLGKINEDTLLLASIKRRKEDIAVMLLEYGASSLISDFSICLNEAIIGRLEKVGQMLIDRGAITSLPEETISYIFNSSIKYGNQDFTRFMLANQQEVKLSFENKKIGFIWAAEHGELQLVEMLVKQLPNINLQDDNGTTALIAAVKAEQLEVIKILLKWGGKTDIKDNNGYTAMSHALMQNCLEAIWILSEYEAGRSSTNKTDLIELGSKEYNYKAIIV